MERKEFSIARFLSSKSRFDNIVLLEGFIVGILAGIVGVVYRLLLSYGEKMAYFVVDYIKITYFIYVVGLYVFYYWFYYF